MSQQGFTIVSLVSGDDDVIFFFNSNGTPLYEDDIFVGNSTYSSSVVGAVTAQYEGNQPAATPKR